MPEHTSYPGERNQEEFDLGFAMRASGAPQQPAPKAPRRSSAARRRPRDLDVKELIAQVRRNAQPGEGTTLSAAETLLWANCKETIRVSERNDVRRALSLFIIHKQQLYRTDYPTWAAFAWDIYSISRSHANRLITYAEFLKGLKIDPFPTERQFRELNRLPGTPEQKQKVWKSAVSESRGGLVTRALLHKAAERYLDYTAPALEESQKQDDTKALKGMVHKRFGLPAGLMLRAAKAAKNMKLSLDDFVQAAIEAMVARSTGASSAAPKSRAASSARSETEAPTEALSAH